MAKFPLDRYLKWQVGVKSLTLNHVRCLIMPFPVLSVRSLIFPSLQSLAIMNDIKDTNDWKYAFRHVPSRKTGLKNEDIKQANLENLSNYASAKLIREQYRRNLVYDLLTKET